VKLTESNLRLIVNQELKTSLNESFDVGDYVIQLRKIYFELIDKVRSGEATFDEVAHIGLPEAIISQLRGAAQKYKYSLRTPEQREASKAKAAATRKQNKMDDENLFASIAARRASELGIAQHRREDGFAPIYPDPQGNMVPNPIFYDSEYDTKSGYVNYRLKDKYVNIRNIGPLYVDPDESNM